MTDEEFLKLARECGATRVAYPDPQCWVGSVAFGDVDFLTLCREIERRALERAAVKCREQAEKYHAEHHLFPALDIERGLRLAMSVGSAKCVDAIRAMIDESDYDFRQYLKCAEHLPFGTKLYREAAPEPKE